ncbi:MAG: hypothetical protein IJA39_00285 [Clostridia bacterium]|nr:hypothetical protein [Clostridia bacterium]
MLNGITMDGLDLGGIMSMLQPILPMLSYFINMLTKAFEIFTSYLGFDVTIPEEVPGEDDANADTGIE